MPAPIDLVGQIYGRLRVIAQAPNKGKDRRWSCICSCGTTHVASTVCLRHGGTLSCGCARREAWAAIGSANRKHGESRRSTYYAWHSMLRRCRDPNHKDWSRYGGRGITVDERWLKYENFLADMGRRPAGLTLDRQDNDGPYAKWNCRWATSAEQRANQRPRIRMEQAA